MIERVNIQGYINFESNIPKKTGLLSFLWIMFIVCIPSAVFGVYSNITKIVMLPLVIIMSLWIIYLLIKTDTKKIQFIFFLGVFSVFISLSFLVAAYKIAATETRVSLTCVILTIVTYVIANFICVFNTLRLIKNGHFKEKRKVENPMGIIFAAGLLGLSLGRVLLGKTSQDTVVAILVIGLIFLGFLFSIGTHNFIKFYFAKKFL
ncbi:MAG: hypothetical protein N2645_01020 [Clostridia bacterium]|nr:hypothetical protein [Clostridia bacterium]